MKELSGQDPVYDVFLSYAREDSAWVRAHVYEPLQRCTTADGRRPDIFMDVTKQGIRPGQNWTEALVAAIRGSRKIVPVYTAIYFSKEMCVWELTKAFQLDPTGSHGRLIPLLVEPKAAAEVPTKVDHINHIDVSLPDWFERLTGAVDFSPPRQPTALRFLDAVPDAYLDHTLPPVRVAVDAPGGVPADEDVTLTAEGASVQGTRTQRSTSGVAAFVDLSITTPASSTRLVASADGCVTAVSSSFCVRQPPAAAAAPADHATVAVTGDVALVGDDGGLIVLQPGRVVVVGADGRQRAPVDVPPRVRILRRGRGRIVLTDWSGNVLLVSLDGSHTRWSCAGQSGRAAVVGDVWIDATEDGTPVFAGLWGGEVYRLTAGEPPALVLRHAAGVQALAVLDGRILACGLDGSLGVYEGDRLLATHFLERTVRLLKTYPGAAVAVGERKLHHVSPSRPTVLTQPLPMAGARAAFGDTDCPIVVDPHGKGIRFDRELFVTSTFHAAAGAVPVSADRLGRAAVLRSRDGSLGLMIDGRVSFTQSHGTLALSSAGDRVAAGDGHAVRVVSISSLVSPTR